MQDTFDTTSTEQAPEHELDGFVVVTSDRPEAAPSPEADAQRAEGKNSTEEAGTAPAQSNQADEEIKPESKHKRRWNRAIQARDEAILRAEAAERKLAELQQQIATPQSDADDDKEPQIEDFKTWDDYEAAKDAWDSKQQEKSVDKTSSQKQDVAKPAEVSPELEAAISDMAESFVAAKGVYPDFDEVIKAKDLVISESLVILMADTDNPGEVAYWLGKHKEEASRISGLSMFKQAKELDKIEATLKSQSTSQPKRTTTAPPPINPLSGNESNKQGYHPAMTQAEFEAWDASQNRQSRDGWL